MPSTSDVKRADQLMNLFGVQRTGKGGEAGKIGE